MREEEFQLNEPSPDGIPEQYASLFVAIIERAIKDYAGQGMKGYCCTAVTQQEVEKWLFQGTRTEGLDFIGICEYLNTDPEYYRKVARKFKEMHARR